jgi:hypothetical protein
MTLYAWTQSQKVVPTRLAQWHEKVNQAGFKLLVLILILLIRLIPNQEFLCKKKRKIINLPFVGAEGIEPPTQGFSVLCSTD